MTLTQIRNRIHPLQRRFSLPTTVIPSCSSQPSAAVLPQFPDTNAAPNPYLQRGAPAVTGNPNPSCYGATLPQNRKEKPRRRYAPCRKTNTNQTPLAADQLGASVSTAANSAQALPYRRQSSPPLSWPQRPLAGPLGSNRKAGARWQIE